MARSTRRSDQESESPALGLSLLTQPSQFLLWLGASAAALGAVFAAAGFLALSTHEAMLGTNELGIPGLLHEPSEYIYAGATFFRDTLSFTLVALLRPVLTAWLPLLIALLGAIGMPRLMRRYPGARPATLVLGGLLLVIAFYVLCGQWLARPLLGKGLLFRQYADVDRLFDRHEILKLIKEAADRHAFASLRTRHGILTLWVVALALVPRFLSKLQEDLQPPPHPERGSVWFWRYLKWPIFGFALLATILLPVHYGAVAIDYSLPQITALTLSDEKGERPLLKATQAEPRQLTLPLLLLHDDADFLTVYNPRCRYVLRLRREHVKTYTAGAPVSIFPTQVAPCPPE